MKRKVVEKPSMVELGKLRSNNITSTNVATLFNVKGMPFLLWKDKKEKTGGEMSPAEGRALWGQRMQSVIAYAAFQEVGRDGDGLADYDNFIHLPELRLGASFDSVIERGSNLVLVECKNVDWKIAHDNWFWAGSEIVEAPAHIELQVQTQMLVMGCELCYLAVLVGGNDLHVLERRPSKSIQDKIIKKTKEFWESIDENKPPQLNWENDAKYIVSSEEQDKDTVDLSDDKVFANWILAYDGARKIEDSVKQTKAVLKAKMVRAMGGHGQAFSSVGHVTSRIGKRGRSFSLTVKE